MPDVPKYWVGGQGYVTQGSAVITGGNQRLVVGANVLAVTTLGTLKFRIPGGLTGTVVGDGTCLVDVGTLYVPTTNVDTGETTVTTSGGTGNITVTLTQVTVSNTSWISSWSAASGGNGGASVTTSADSVYFDANSFTAASQTATVDATMNCLNMDWTGATNTPTLAGISGTIYIYGSTVFISDMVMTPAFYIIYKPADNTKTITTNGKVLPFDQYINGVGTLTALDTINVFVGQAITLVAGTFVSQSIVGCGMFVISGAGAKTLTLGNYTINCGNGGASTAWNYSGSNLTLTANTSTIKVTGTGVFTGGTPTGSYYNIELNGTAHTVSGTFTCNKLTRTGTATNANTVTFTSGTTITVTDTITLTGNSRANQLLAQSSVLGTAATIHATTWVVTNTDFMDINFDTHLPDFSAQDDVGDCGGNKFDTVASDGTKFPAGAAQTSVGAGNWSHAAEWTSRIPLPQDDVSCSHNMTVDMPRIGKSVTFTGTPTVSLSNAMSVYGSLTLSSGMTYTHNSNANNFCGRGSFILTTNGIVISGFAVFCPNGTLTLGSNLTWSTSSWGAIYNGTFNASSYNMLGGLFTSSYISVREIQMGSGIWTINATGAAYKFNMTTTTNLTFNAGTSTIILTNSGTNAQGFAGGGLTYNNVTVQGAGAYALTITENNVFNTFTVDASVAAKTVTFIDGSITTIYDLIKSGTNQMRLNGTGVAGWALVKTGPEIISVDNALIEYSNASPAFKFYATNSTLTSTTGWNTPADARVIKSFHAERSLFGR
jgi:hypothetical protein